MNQKDFDRALKELITAKLRDKPDALMGPGSPGGARAGAGRPPLRGEAMKVQMSLKLTEAEAAEIEAEVPIDYPGGRNRWIIEAAVARARSS